jgi:signal transduction histidine kinase
MKKLVEDLLFLARVDSKENNNMHGHFDLSDTIFQSALSFEALMFESNNKFNIDVTPEIYIDGNPSQIKQLVSIFIDNARKYSYDNSKITLRLYKENNKALLSINNFSDPIDKKDLPYIFDRFYKIDKARKRESNSYGLGLAIAKEIVLMHNGKISVSSDKENCTTFMVTFPVVNK